jgi:tRNA (mo5U34)-methyltransferase
VVTRGWWDLRPTAERIPWPASLAGLRCLDIGTMDGFWAFELERRGADEVVATDVVDPAASQDLPVSRRNRPPTQPRLLRGATFRLAAEALASNAEYRDRNVYDLDPAVDGEFDLVFMGYVLQMLRDPLRGLEAVRGVCRGSLILLDTVSLPLSLLPAPLARLNARRGALEWFVFNRRGLAQALRMAGFEPEAETGIIRDRPGPAVTRQSPRAKLAHGLGILGRSAAIRGR